MNKFQTGLERLEKKSKDSQWLVSFRTLDTGESKTFKLSKTLTEAGPRFKEVLNRIEAQEIYPRNIYGSELKRLNMSSPESFVIRYTGESLLSIEATYTLYREFAGEEQIMMMSMSARTIGTGVNTPEIADAIINSDLPKVDKVMPNSPADRELGSKLNQYEDKNKNVEDTNPVKEGATRTVYGEEEKSNLLDFVKPVDDRADYLFPEGANDRVRIGDVMLTIPPLSIAVERVSDIAKVKTLRTKSSMLLRGGSSNQMITMELYFHDLDNINGIRRKMTGQKGRFYYMDGLRSLIAQFKKAPFLPIDNEYLNETHDIHSVALVGLSVNTVPGFPHSLSATLTLTEFEHETYMPQIPYMADAVNYPLLRWYYQEALRDDIPESQRSPYRTWLDPIPASGLNNDFSFQMVDEQLLMERESALEQLSKMSNPRIAWQRFKNPDGNAGDENDPDRINGQLYRDALAAQDALDSYKKYKDLEAASDLDKAAFKATGEWEYAVYGNKVRPIRSKISGIYDGYENIFLVKILNEGNQRMLPWQISMSDVYDIDAKDIHILEKIVAKGIQAEDEFMSKVGEYDDLMSVAEMTEGDLPLDDYPILGEMTPINLSVSYENQFSRAQLQGMEAPTLQFMGGQDPYIQMSFETNQEAVEDLRTMMSEVERMSKTYKKGITSGFLGIKNHLTQLFGVRTVMPETLKIRTVPGFPGRFHVDMTMIGFNKTQARTEKLEGISPIYGSTADKESRNHKNYNQSADDAIIQLKMQKLELYPDLELPRLSELVEALPYIGAEMEEYSPEITSEYVDPDFYMSTTQTFREIVKQQRNENQRLDMKDSMGISAWTDSQSGAAYDMDEESWAAFSALDAEVQQASHVYDWNGASILGDSGMGPVQYQSQEITDYMAKTFGGVEAALPKGESTSPYSGWPVNSPYGPRSFDGFHWGVDFGGTLGTPIYTPHGGEVLQAQFVQQGGGNQVVIYNPNFNKTFIFMHMSANLSVKKGQIVNPGQKVGEMNTTGNSSGVHLHYQVNEGKGFARNEDAVSPMSWLESKAGSFIDGASAAKSGSTSSVAKPTGNPDGWKKDPLNKGGKNPSDAQVYTEIYKWVDELFVNSGIAYNDKQTAKNNEKWQNVAYATPADMRAMFAHYLKNSVSGVKKAGAEEEFVNANKRTFKGTSNKIPRERIANYVKALFDMNSGWKQFEGSGKPKIDSRKDGVGISGVPIAYAGSSVEVTKKLIWNWKYNIEAGMRRFHEGYTKATKEKGKHAIRPWDYGIMYYAFDNMSEEVNVAYVSRAEGRFKKYNAYAYIHRTPKATMDSKIVGIANHLTETQTAAATGETAGMAQTIVDMGYREKKVDKNWLFNAFGNKDEMYSKTETLDILKKKPQKEMKKIYDDYLNSKKDIGKPSATDGGQLALVHATSGGQDGGKNQDVYERSEDIDNLKAAEADIEEHEARKLIHMNQPDEVFPYMMHDIVHYDHRMRLLRAFPTFQMFIVDEGQWVSSYRLWDNLYGFNAIESIDVHKSRKIAADTAVIKMTNMYSNLTTRGQDMSYDEWDYSFWDNFLWGNPDQEMIDGRNDLLSGMMLEAGARIHLRMGYGSSANDLPVVFNGTITEMDTGPTVTIVCQGDGVELGSIISGDPDDDTKELFKDPEPRAIMGDLLTSKGNWLKDVIGDASDGKYFREHPLGIVHFGNPSGEGVDGSWKFFNEDYGETAQNLYSTNGLGTFSQWMMPDGTDIKRNWSEFDMTEWTQAGDEDNVAIRLYNNTFWDVAQTLAYCSPDYIAAVHPFEMRSTFFFGKPYWGLAHKYDSEYKYNAEEEEWTRSVQSEYRKPYSQFHYFDSYMDIIGNGIKASSDGVYTNVIVSYDGKQTPILYADKDIHAQHQKTTVVEAEISSNVAGMDFFTSEKQAEYFGASTIRDYMKDMYKGELIVMGDPTLKPFDVCYMDDIVYDMKGSFLVGSVTHQFSHETGFITSAKADANVVTDDLAMISIADWGKSMGIGLASFSAGMIAGSRAMKKFMRSAQTQKALKSGGVVAQKANHKLMKGMVRVLSDESPEIAELKKLIKEMDDLDFSSTEGKAKSAQIQKKAEQLDAKIKSDKGAGKYKNIKGVKSYPAVRAQTMMLKNQAKALSSGKDAFNIARASGGVRLALNLGKVSPAGIVVSVVSAGLIEKYRRKKANAQTVIMLPLTSNGKSLTAGITGHAGMVVGDKMGKYDMLYSGIGTSPANKDGIVDTFTELYYDTANILSGDFTEYTTTYEDIAQKD